MAGRRSPTNLQRISMVLAGSMLGLLAAWLIFRPTSASRDRDAFHLYVVGGSSAWGEPYAPYIEDLLGRLVSMQFNHRLSGRRVKVHTPAQPGAHLRNLEPAIKAIETRQHPPNAALVLIYSGHNEFIRLDAHRDLRDNPRQLIDEPIVTTEDRRAILEDHIRTLAEFVDRLTRAGVGVVVSTVAANVGDWDPNRSIVRNRDHAGTIKLLHSNARSSFAEGNWQACETELKKLLAVEPDFAHGHFLLGKTLQMLGRTNEAKSHLQSAKDLDANPTRITTWQNDAIRTFCTSNGIPLADSLKALEAASPGGIIGTNMIWDNVHPRLEAFQIMATTFAREVSRITGDPCSVPLPGRADLERSLGIDRELMAVIYAGRGQTCYGHATRTWDTSWRLTLAESYFRNALAISPREPDILCSVAVMQLMRGETEKSLTTWREAFVLDAETAQRRIGNLHVRQLFNRQGIPDAMKTLQR